MMMYVHVLAKAGCRYVMYTFKNCNPRNPYRYFFIYVVFLVVHSKPMFIKTHATFAWKARSIFIRRWHLTQYIYIYINVCCTQNQTLGYTNWLLGWKCRNLRLIYIYIYIQGFGYRDIWGVVHIGWRDKNVSTTFSCRAVIWAPELQAIDKYQPTKHLLWLRTRLIKVISTPIWWHFGTGY